MLTKKKTKTVEKTKKTTTRGPSKLWRATQEVKALKGKVTLASEIIFYLLKAHNDGCYADEFKTVYNATLDKEFGVTTTDEFHFEVARDVLLQRSVVSAGKITLLKELPTPEMSPVYGKG